MPIFVPGQRWISENEPELGLGTVLAAESQRVTILFATSNERRTYAANNAPLARVRFAVGEPVESAEGWVIEVSVVSERDGLLTYSGKSADGLNRDLTEGNLNPYLQFNKPQDRLFIGQIDPSALFELRYLTLQKQGALAQSATTGLVGARTNLIPHQLYIAHEISNRHAPRVLLADEVGLGKTIEAGLILHRRLLTGRAERVLILVPDPLLHQWLVEMRRRFNLKFSLFDEEHFLAFLDGNPFENEQLVLCGMECFRDEPDRQQQVIEAGWDLCVVDEAHHLAWSEDEASADYQFVEKIAWSVPGLLLLTATPEQLGKQSHFARLRLLDPDRFFSFEQFLREEQEYQPLAQMIETLSQNKPLKPGALKSLKALLANDKADELLEGMDNPERAEQQRQQLIDLLLDRHGTGRILFRNTRATVKGFPPRRLHASALPFPPEYQTTDRENTTLDNRLFPERQYASGNTGDATPWWRIDPRVTWLADTLKSIRPAKALVICAKARTAMDLEEALRVLAGVSAAVFHEAMGIVARDRAAAYFADEEAGAQVLVCSEIGSEGRNFQFAHHLLLFDLPLNPDQLEQRIGRLDRIGQRNTIDIHVPYFENSAQHLLFRWYQEGLDAFDHPCAAGQAVFAAFGDELKAQLLHDHPFDQEELINRARRLNAETLQQLHDGRDRLLELNSCRKTVAAQLMTDIEVTEGSDDLWPYMESVLEAYGVHTEEHSEHCHILLPGDHMRLSNFPELPEDGVTITLDRRIALAREDMFFLSWEHPMVVGAMDLIVNSEHGNAAFAVVSHDDLDSGQLLLEAIYRVECPAPKRLGLGRFMPQSMFRCLYDQQLQDLAALPRESLAEIPQLVDREELGNLLRSQRKIIEKMLKTAQESCQKQIPGLIAEATRQMLEYATTELKRLSALKKVNPSVRQEELDQLKADAMAMHGHIQSAQLRLDSIKVMLTS